MKTPDTVETMPSATSRHDSIESDDFDQITFQLSEVFGLTPDQLFEICEEFSLDWSVNDLKMEIGMRIARIAGYPSTEMDQQPYDVPHMFPLELRETVERFDAADEIEDAITRKMLFYFWGKAIEIRGGGKCIDQINEIIKKINISILYILTGQTRSDKRNYLDTIRWINILRLQHGLHDLDTGLISERRKYLLRQVIFREGVQNSASRAV